jgi:DNA polymerase
MSDKTVAMKEIRDELFAFKESPLYEYRVENNYFPVIGEGSHDARIVFIGEAPGENEAKQGRPFCGASGRILDELLAHIGLLRKDVYVTNVVKDRPPGNRDPRPEEIELYAPFLLRQLDIIQPNVIAALGRFGMQFVLSHFKHNAGLPSISEAHGKTISVSTPEGTEMTLVPLYHPAVALYNGSQKDVLKKDFEVLKAFL